MRCLINKAFKKSATPPTPSCSQPDIVSWAKASPGSSTQQVTIVSACFPSSGIFLQRPKEKRQRGERFSSARNPERRLKKGRAENEMLEPSSGDLHTRGEGPPSRCALNDIARRLLRALNIYERTLQVGEVASIQDLNSRVVLSVERGDRARTPRIRRVVGRIEPEAQMVHLDWTGRGI